MARDGAFTSRRGPGEGSVARRQTPDSCAGWRIRRDKNRLPICATRGASRVVELSCTRTSHEVLARLAYANKKRRANPAGQGLPQNVRSTPPCTLEGQRVEVKGWCSNPKELSREIAGAAACLANADGGVIFVGVLDKKAAPSCFKTCPYEDVNPDWIEERVSVLTKPAVTCRAYWVRELMPELAAATEGSMIVVGVPRTTSLELHKFGGVCYKRKDDECPIEYSTSADDYSDILIPSLTAAEVDPGSLAQVLENLSASVRHGITGLDFLRNAGLVRRDPQREQDKDLLTVAGLLLLGRPAAIGRALPHAQVAFSFLDHSGLSKAGRTETLNIFQAIPRFLEELQGVWPLQAETLHEVLVNALIHRDRVASKSSSWGCGGMAEWRPL